MQLHAIVYGRVQGVWYRGTTREMAKKMNLKGWVRNNYDGTVELMAQGEKEKLYELLKWLHKGPRYAKVKKVEHEFLEISENFIEFRIKY